MVERLDLGRGRRVKRPTWKLVEQLPQPPSLPRTEPSPPASTTIPSTSESSSPAIVEKLICTAKNVFGLFREYPNLPTHNPDDTASPTLTTQPSQAEQPESSHQPLTVSGLTFANETIALLMNWQSTGSSLKSIAECDRLIKDVLSHPSFRVGDLQNISLRQENARLDEQLHAQPDGWRESTVKIEVPNGQRHGSPDNPPIPTFSIPGLQHRSFVETIKATWADENATHFHYTPFRQFVQQQPDATSERIYDELYSSDAFLEAHKALQNQPPEPDCSLERVVCALMFWSDSTHLASFGTASLWPVYMFFGNQSKYERCAPSSGACHHVAYIPKVCVA